MKEISATDFIKRVGAHLDEARRAPVAVTRHGRASVVVLAHEEYQRLLQQSLPARPAPGTLRVADPLGMALTTVNVSVAKPATAADLRRAVGRRDARLKPVARRLVEEVPEPVLAGLVRTGFTDWKALHAAALWAGSEDHEKTAFIRDMAGLPLG